MKKHLKIVSLILLIIIILQILPIYAEPPEVKDPENAMYPSVKDLFGGKNTSPYLTSYRPNYSFDLKSPPLLNKAFIDYMMNSLANFMFYIQKGIAYVAIVVVYFSYEIDFINRASPSNPYGLGFGDVLEDITKKLKTYVFDEVVLLMILLLGLFYAIKIIRDQKTQVWIAIIQTVLIIALAFGFFEQPKLMLSAIDNTAKGFSEIILAGTYSAVDKEATPSSAAMMACNDIWVMFVHKPWQIMEFGSSSLAEKYEKQILSLPTDSEQRSDIIDSIYDSDNTLFTPRWGPSRLGAIMLSLIPILAEAAIIMLICLLKLGYSFLMILVAMFGFIVFIMALVPWWGFRSLQSWLSKLIAYGCMGVLISFVIALIFTFITILYDQTDKLGWYMVIIIQLLIIIMVIWKRDKIFDFITTFRSAQYGPAAVNKALRKDANLEGKLASSVRSRREGREQEEERSSKSSRRDKYAVESAAQSEGESKVRRTNPKVDSFMYNIGIGDKQEKPYYSDEKSVDNLVDMMWTSNDILEKRYQTEKAMEDDRARLEGRNPKYSKFVSERIKREASENKFDNKEVFGVINEMKYASQAENDLEDLYPTEASYVDINKEGRRLLVDRKSGRELNNKEIAKLFTEEFNNTHDAAVKDSEMLELIDKHGWEDTKQLMETLRKRKLRKGAVDAPMEKLSKKLNDKEYDWFVESIGKSNTTKHEKSESKGKGSGKAVDKSESKDIHREGIYHDEWQTQPAQNDSGSKDFKTLLKLAEEILEAQYEAAKNEAESKAERNGKKPEYSHYVQGAMSREAMNLPKFEDRQKIAVANELKRIYASGGSVDNLNAGSSVTELKRPKSVIEIQMASEGTRRSMDTEVRVKSVADLGKEYVNDFNSEFDKKYDSKFMENLIHKYGDEQVKNVLERMKDIQLKDKRISNPAGYLTEALRNNKRDKVSNGDE